MQLLYITKWTWYFVVIVSDGQLEAGWGGSKGELAFWHETELKTSAV